MESEESSEEIVIVVDDEVIPEELAVVGLESGDEPESEDDQDSETQSEQEVEAQTEFEAGTAEDFVVETEDEDISQTEQHVELDESLGEEAQNILDEIETVEIGTDKEQLDDEEIDSLNELIQGKEEIIPDEIETVEIGAADEQMGDEEIESLNDLIQHKDENVYEVEEVVESESDEDKLMFDESFFDGVIENPEKLAASVTEEEQLSEPELMELPEEVEPQVADRKEEAEPELIDIPLYDEVAVPDEPTSFKHLDAHGEIKGQDSENTGEDLINTQMPLVETPEYVSTNEYEESTQEPLIQEQDNGNTIKDESRAMEEETEPPKSQLSVLIKMLIVLAVIIATYFILQASGYLRGKNAVKTDENLAQGALVIVDSNLLADNREYPFNKDTQNEVNIKGAAFKDGRYFEVEENGTLNPVLYDTSTEKTYKVFVTFDSAAAEEDKKS
ncbi:MAG: hypothetical protein IPJ75_19400 [Ignavibacteriales bacterium]|nr:hypothetical protein [Ignavibacteriales bacterium]